MKMRKTLSAILCLMMVATVFVVAVPKNVNSEEPGEDPGFPEEPELPEEPGMMGEGEWWIEGNGTYFELTNSTYLNVILTSSEQVYIYMESVPKVVSYHIEADCIATTTEITLIDFEVNKNYYRYQNGDLHDEFTTDETGSYSYTQDISTRYHVFIQETKSTIYIRPDGSLTDEYGNPITPPIEVVGDTYTLTDNIDESIYIQKSGITLDGNGHSITGSNTIGLYINGLVEVTIQDVEVIGFSTGVYMAYTNASTITQNTVLSSSHTGIRGHTVDGNTVSENIVSSSNGYGISVYYAYRQTIRDNTITVSNNIGIYVSGGYHNITGNTVSECRDGIWICWIWQSGYNNVTGNIVTDNSRYGIAIDRSSYNVLRNNVMTGNRFNFGSTVSTIPKDPSYYIQDIDTSNTVDGKPIYYWIGRSHETVPLDAGYVGLVNSDNMTVEGLTLANNIQSVLFVSTNDSSILNLDVSGNYDGIFLNYARNNTITGSTIRDSYNDGIRLENSEKNVVELNTLTGNMYGIEPFISHDTVIRDNTATGNSRAIWVRRSDYCLITDNIASNNKGGGGIYLAGSDTCTITNNVVSNSGPNRPGHGIHMENSQNNFLRDNEINDNRMNFGVRGNSISHYIHDIDTSNTINGKPIYYWVGHNHETVPLDAGYVGIVSSHNITVKDITFPWNWQGVLFVDTNDSTIQNVEVTRAAFGIYLFYSNRNVIKENTAKYGGGGIELVYSDDNIIDNNVASSNRDGARPPMSLCGMRLIDSSNNTITNNEILTNWFRGMEVGGWFNTISGNTISGHKYGLILWEGGSHTVFENTISSSQWGIYLTRSQDNLIYHNNIINNIIQAYDSGPANNNWHHPDLLEGNYWSDYLGVDDGSGTEKHAIAGDRIGDTLIPHPDTDYDFYPFTEPDAWLNAPPIANAGGPYEDYEGTEITFDASLSSDPDGDQLQYRWDFENDGIWDTDYSTDPTATCTWDDDYSGSVAVEVYDGALTDISTAPVIVLNAAPVANAGADKVGDEPATFIFTGSHTDSGILDTHTYEWDFDYDGVAFDADDSGNGILHTWLDDFTGTIALRVTDNNGDFGIDTLTVTVLNADPIITSITSPFDPTRVSSLVEISCDFTDPGILDTHIALIDWGDETTSPGTVIEVDGSGTATGSHIYENPGVYTVTMTIFDDDGGEASATTEYVVIYDPTGAFVTGGGMIDSPEGAIPHQPEVTGKAGFGFVSKYQKGASTPGGNTQFRFHAADINFQSDSYDWLVVAGPKAMFKGTGTINGEGNYGFLISAIDGDIPGGGGVDRFRIKIWDKATGDIVYDNGLGAPEDADPASPLTHGSIKIHKG